MTTLTPRFVGLWSTLGFPLYPEILQHYTMIQQRPRLIVGDDGICPRSLVRYQ